MNAHLQAYQRCFKRWLDLQGNSTANADLEALEGQMSFHWANLSQNEVEEFKTQKIELFSQMENEMTTATVNANVYQGRFGFHQVSYETYKKLKMLHKHYWETVYAVARWVAWDRKTVNQVGEAPAYCPVFVQEKGHSRVCTHKDGITGEIHKGFKWYPKTLQDHGIIEAYKQAKTPCLSEEDVKPLNLSVEEIDRLYNEVKAWVG